MAEQSISCPSCGKKIPLTRALRAEIEASVKDDYNRQLAEEVERARKEAAKHAEKKASQELAALKDELTAQAKELEHARQVELAMRKRERDLERQREDLELTVARKLDEEANASSPTRRRVSPSSNGSRTARKSGARGHAPSDRGPEARAEQGSQQLQGSRRGGAEATPRPRFHSTT
jgi:hypothetical protein